MFDIHYNAREEGGASLSVTDKLEYALAITISAPKIGNLHQLILDAEEHARGMAEEHAREIERMAWHYECLARRCAASKTSKSTRRSVYGGFRTA